MVQHWCARWRAQHRCVLPVLVRTGKLRGEEPGFIGGAYASLLAYSAILVFESTWGKLRGVEGRILDWFVAHHDPLLVSVSLRV